MFSVGVRSAEEQEFSVGDVKTNVHIHVKHHSSSHFDVTFKLSFNYNVSKRKVDQ